jgi:hypothetical protein
MLTSGKEATQRWLKLGGLGDSRLFWLWKDNLLGMAEDL